MSAPASDDTLGVVRIYSSDVEQSLLSVLSEVVTQVLAFSSALLVLAIIGLGIYMHIGRGDPFTGKATPQPRSKLQWLSLFFMSLMLLTTFLFWLVPGNLYTVRVAVLGAGILFMVLSILFFLRFLRAWRRESRVAKPSTRPTFQ